MKNNKAFTIVELLAVMILLAIILLVAYPNFSKLTENAKTNYDNSIKILAKSAAKMYVNNNKEEINDYFANNPTGTYCLPLAKLSAYDYIDSYLKDSSDEIVDMKSCVNITKTIENEKIKYKYELSNDKVSDDVDYLPPVLTVNNKVGGTLDCQTTISVSSKDDFYNNCMVVSSDNVDGSNIITGIETTIKDSNNVVITYDSTDSSSNKAKTLKVKLIIK